MPTTPNLTSPVSGAVWRPGTRRTAAMSLSAGRPNTACGSMPLRRSCPIRRQMCSTWRPGPVTSHWRRQRLATGSQPSTSPRRCSTNSSPAQPRAASPSMPESVTQSLRSSHRPASMPSPAGTFSGLSENLTGLKWLAISHLSKRNTHIIIPSTNQAHLRLWLPSTQHQSFLRPTWREVF